MKELIADLQRMNAILGQSNWSAVDHAWMRETTNRAISALQQSDGPRLPEGYSVDVAGELIFVRDNIREETVWATETTAIKNFLWHFLPKPETAVEMNVSSATVETSKGSGDTAGGLLPCPFCGGPAMAYGPEQHRGLIVECQSCNLVLRGDPNETEPELWAAWNTRATPSDHPEEQRAQMKQYLLPPGYRIEANASFVYLYGPNGAIITATQGVWEREFFLQFEHEYKGLMFDEFDCMDNDSSATYQGEQHG